MQPSLLCSKLKAFVVVGVPATAVLDPFFIVKIMNHFMQQRRGDFLYRARQCACSNIDLMAASNGGDPSVILEGEMAIGLGSGLNGDGRP